VPNDAELIVALVVSSRAGERDLLLLLLGGASTAEAARRLHLSPEALAERLRRVRRRAAAIRKRGTG